MERFGFNVTPFTNEFAVKNRFKLDFVENEVKELKKTAEDRLSAVFIAPAGAGKSQVLRSLRDALPTARYSCHYVKVTDLSPRDMCREIAWAAGAEPAGNYPALVRSVQKYFENALRSDGLRQVLMIDEAQDLRPHALSLLKIITNFEMDSKLVVSVILAGQPSLKNMLYRPGLEDIRRRLAHCGELRLMSREESKKYVEHRVRVAGASKIPFDGSAIEAIFEMSHGNLGAIDKLAYKSLAIADEASRSVVDSNDVVEARKGIWI